MKTTLWLAKASTNPELYKLRIRALGPREVKKIRREVEAMPSPFIPNVKMKIFPVRVERVIDMLRRVHGGTWKFEPRGHTYLQTSTGRRVYWSAPPMGGYDWENEPGQLRWEDTKELVSHW